MLTLGTHKGSKGQRALKYAYSRHRQNRQKGIRDTKTRLVWPTIYSLEASAVRVNDG